MENEEVQTVEETTGEETEATELAEIVEVDVERPFLSTPLNEYTVTEGLLLLIFLYLVGRSVMGWIKEGFFWLW